MEKYCVVSYQSNASGPQNFYIPFELIGKYKGHKYAYLNVSGDFKILVKLRAIENTSLKKCCYFDDSVVIPNVPWEQFDPNFRNTHKKCISLSDVKFLGTYQWCQSVNVVIVTSTTSALRTFKNQENLSELKELLKLYVLSSKCVIYTDRLHVFARFGCYCIIVENEAENPNIVYRISEKTIINVVNAMSYSMLNQKLILSHNIYFDSLFISGTQKRVNQLQKIAHFIKSVVELSQIPTNIPLAIRPDKNVLLSGPTGSGKSSIIHAVARTLSFIVLSTSCGGISPSPPYEFEEIFKKARSHIELGEPCIILLKDIDLISTKKNDEVSLSSKKSMASLCYYLDEIRTIQGASVIATTASPENVDLDLRRAGRFCNEIEVPMLNEIDRSEIVRQISKRFLLPCDDVVSVEVANWTAGYLFSDFMAMLREAFNYFRQSMDESIDAQLLYYKKAVVKTPSTALKGTRGLINISSIETATFNDIGGLENVKKILQQSVMWPIQHPEAFARLGIPPTKGILLFGPPGCAKTTLVKALATESNATFLAVSAADLYSPYVGESEKRLSKLFTQARISTPAIIFLDEIDSIVGHKGSEREHGVQERILATLLIEMDGVGVHVHTTDASKKVAEGESLDSSPSSSTHRVSNAGIIVVGAGNRPDLLDDALKRPGRFDKLVYITPPNEEERLAILTTITRQMSLSNDVDLKSIAQRTKHYSGADLKNLCVESGLLALTKQGMNVLEIGADHFEVVLKTYKPSLKKYKDISS